MRAEDCLRNGNVREALASVQEEIRSAPAKPELRIFIFQLLSVLGQWERAMTQLNVAAEMDADALMMAHLYRPALNSEALRAEIFEGKRKPVFLGEPEEWMVQLTEVLPLLADGKNKAAGQMREQAFEAAPVISGTVNDAPFEWIADADMRLGPMLEVIVNGNYYWVPFEHIQEIQLEEPSDLRDVVWARAQFTWENGGQAAGLIPTRYPASEQSEDDLITMARKTDWQEVDGGFCHGLGQRMLATEEIEYPLLEIRRIALDHTPSEQQ